MTKRDRAQQLDKQGEAYVEGVLSEFIVNRVDNDFGIDFDVTLTSSEDDGDLQEVTGSHFFIQLKSSQQFGDGDSVYWDLDTEKLKLYLEKPVPVLIVIYDHTVEEAYWLVVQEFIWDDLRQHNPDWRSQGTVRIRIDRSQTLDDTDRIETAVNRVYNRIVRTESRSLNIGEGIAFTPDDFDELDEQIETDRLSYKGHLLQKTRELLKRGEESEAKQALDQVLQDGEDDRATLSALFMEMYLRNPADVDEAMEIVEIADEAIDLAMEIGQENDALLANVHYCVGGLFILMDKHRELIVADRVKGLVGPGIPGSEYLRNQFQNELLSTELRTIETLNSALSELRDNDAYYRYSIALSPVIDYLATRTMWSHMGAEATPDPDDEPHHIVQQASQLVDFIEDPEAVFGLKKSIALYYYYTLKTDLALEFLTEARDIAIELDDHPLAANTNELIERFETVPNPYDPDVNEDDEDVDREEAAQSILSLHGFDIDPNEPVTQDDDSTEAVLKYGVRDSNPEPVHRHCEHIRMAYEPSPFGEELGMVSVGEKILWCRHGGAISGVSLDHAFEAFETEFCDGCEYHSPRPEEWEFTDEYGQQQVEDPEFQAFLDKRREAMFGSAHTDEEESTDQ